VRERLISEALRPVFDQNGPAISQPGAPQLPTAFVWRGETWPLLEVIEQGRDVGPCTHGSGEQYVRKHWYLFQSRSGVRMRVYFERRPRGRAVQRRRWLYSLADGDGGSAT